MNRPSTGEGRGKVRTRWGIAAAMALALGVVVGPVGCGETRDPNKPLSDEEGAALLQDIRAGKTTVSDLTPADRVYLKKKMGK